MDIVDSKILNRRKQYLKWSYRLIFEKDKLFLNGAIAIEKEKCEINLNKPI